LKPFEQQSADHLRLVLDIGHIGIWELDPRTGHAATNLNHDQIFGYPDKVPNWHYDQFLNHIIDEDRERVDELQKTAMQEGRVWSFDCRIETIDGHFRWIKAAGRPLTDEGGEITRVIGHVIDITEIKHREERLYLVTDELNHRVRNMLALIKSIVRLSSRGFDSVADFAKTLEGRVAALARSHNFLVGDIETELCPSAILETELSAFKDIEGRIDVAVKKEAELSSSAAQGLSLVLHELMTNAIKYGALSNETGRIFISIDRVGNLIEIQWREQGGPPVSPESREGFGSKLIASALSPDGRTEHTLSLEGVECWMAIKLR
jgi:PAS domain S-box-containing protein